ncbi:hypothetical protein DA2_2834 [Desulfovibrio sp. A2]|nr:hypothetical protein DA2_2834 [Desulfovibrio sp. A2]
MDGGGGAEQRLTGQERGTVRAARGLFRLSMALLVPVVVAGLVALAVPARALDDIANLKGMGVVAAGQVKRLDCPASGRFNCNSWPSNFLKFEYENICFATDPGVCGAYCKGILATDKSKSVYFFESLPGGDLAQRRARGYECPPGF